MRCKPVLTSIEAKAREAFKTFLNALPQGPGKMPGAVERMRSTSGRSGPMDKHVEGVPTVSICLPVYNGENYLAIAIELMLAQTFADFELIICDNASTDRTEAICRRFAANDARLRYSRLYKHDRD